MNPFQRFRVDVWSDYVCPFCYLEQPVLDRLCQQHGRQVQVQWHAFELRPEPSPTLDPKGEYLRTVWESSVYPMARQRGLKLQLPPVQPRSRKALEAAEFARDKGCYRPMHYALFKAFFEDGRDLNDLEVLTDTGRKIGLDPDELRQALDTEAYRDKVLADEEVGNKLRLGGVPAIVVRREGEPLQRGILVGGAQPCEILEAALERLGPVVMNPG